MAVTDKTLGGTLLLTGGSVFLYYTIWTMLLPFFDSSSPVHIWFPPREWAMRIPAFILVVGISAAGLFIGYNIIDNHPLTNDSRRRSYSTPL